MGDDACADQWQALGMLASALAGRAVAVAGLPPGEPAWTDGQTIYVDACTARDLSAPTSWAGCCGTASWPSAT